MKLHALVKLALALTLTATGIGCGSADPPPVAGDSADVVSAREVPASKSPEHAMLAGLWRITPVAADDMTLRIYETGGGDPAMNGNQLWLGADNGEGGMFDLALNVLTVEKAERTAPGKILLAGQRNGGTSTGDITVEPWQATITFTTSNGAFGSVITVAHDSVEEKVVASTESSAKFLGYIYGATTDESPDGATIARAFVEGGGDPAMNGARVFLSIMSYPEERTYELGLNVAGVKKLEHTSATELRLEGSEDIMSPSGDIVQRPFAYSVKFQIRPDGVPSDSIKLARLPR